MTIVGEITAARSTGAPTVTPAPTAWPTGVPTWTSTPTPTETPTPTSTPLPPDFGLNIMLGSQPLVTGGSTDMTVTIDPINAFHEVVALSTTGLPTGLTGKFTPTSFTPPGTSILTLSLAADAPDPGHFAFDVIASGGGISHSLTISFSTVVITPPTQTPTPTRTQTLTPTTTLTPTVTSTPTLTSTPTSTGTATASPTPSPTATSGPPDFTLLVSPSTQYLAPGGRSIMTLNIASVNGFHDLVQLSASGLPNGVSATFSPASVTPSGVATLYVDAAADAPAAALQSFTIAATGGGISHSTQASLTVNFGLVPICTGAFTGVVTDTETGLPIPNAIVGIGYGVYVDSNGRFNFTGLSLGQANAPVTYTVNSGADGYWYTSVSALAQCGVVTTVNIQLLPERFGHVIGTVYEGIPDPNNLSEARAVTPTGTKIGGASIVEYSSPVATGRADGTYDLSQVKLGQNNTPRYHTYAALHSTNQSLDSGLSVDGYWRSPMVSVFAAVNETRVVDLAMVRQCSGSVTYTVIDQVTRQPVPSAAVTLYRYSPGASFSGQTDADGRVVFPTVLLGYNNAQTVYNLSFSPSDNPGTPYMVAYSAVSLVHCNDTANGVLELQRPQLPNYGNVRGFVYDL